MDKFILDKLENSIGKEVMFSLFCFYGENKTKINDCFCAKIVSVNAEYLTVNQTSIDIDKEDKITLRETERTLYHGKYIISKDTPLN